MPMPDRDVGIAFHLDTNRINAKGRLENVNRLEQWDRDGVVVVDMSGTARDEAMAGSDSKRRAKAFPQIHTLPTPLTPKEEDVYRRIAEILYPDGITSDNQRNDVQIVFDARKYGRILVTDDGASARQPHGLLGSRDRLFAELGIRIFTDAEAVQLVEEKIAVRDQNAQQIAEQTGLPLPPWVGKD